MNRTLKVLSLLILTNITGCAANNIDLYDNSPDAWRKTDISGNPTGYVNRDLLDKQLRQQTSDEENRIRLAEEKQQAEWQAKWIEDARIHREENAIADAKYKVYRIERDKAEDQCNKKGMIAVGYTLSDKNGNPIKEGYKCEAVTLRSKGCWSYVNGAGSRGTMARGYDSRLGMSACH